MLLGTAGDWANVILPEGSCLFAAQGDIKDYFYACGISSELSEYFSLPPVSGARLRGLGVFRVSGLPVGPEELVFPQLAVMPMGWSWAF